MDKHSYRTINRFDHWADTYDSDRISSWFKYYQMFALNSFNLVEKFSVLEIGCGTGWAVIEISKNFHCGKACGIDISTKMIKKAEEKSRNIAKINFSVANAENIPFQKESFDFILCTFSFHHYSNPLGALSEMKRVLKKTGELIIIDPAKDVFFPIRIQDWWRRLFERSHVKYYSTDEIKCLAEQAKFNLAGRIFTEKKFLFNGKIFTGLMALKLTK